VGGCFSLYWILAHSALTTIVGTESRTFCCLEQTKRRLVTYCERRHGCPRALLLHAICDFCVSTNAIYQQLELTVSRSWAAPARAAGAAHPSQFLPQWQYRSCTSPPVTKSGQDASHIQPSSLLPLWLLYPLLCSDHFWAAPRTPRCLLYPWRQNWLFSFFLYSLQAAKSTGINALMLNEVTVDKFFLITDKILVM